MIRTLTFDVDDPRMRDHMGSDYLCAFLTAHGSHAAGLCYRFEVCPTNDGIITIYEYDPIILDDTVPLDGDHIPVLPPVRMPLRQQLPPELLRMAMSR